MTSKMGTSMMTMEELVNLPVPTTVETASGNPCRLTARDKRHVTLRLAGGETCKLTLTQACRLFVVGA